MKLVTWNCCGAFRDKKADCLFALDPDIAIIQECSEKDAQHEHDLSYSSHWFGDPRQKGLALFHKSEWAITSLGYPSHKWVAAFKVAGPKNFTLVAVWSCPYGKAPQRYVRLIREALAASPHWFENGPAIVAGDFNSNCQWDRPKDRHHASVVEGLAQLNLISAYHWFAAEKQGEESKKTFYQYRHLNRPYHIDYIFMPEVWIPQLKCVEVGTHSEWRSHSDHCPILLHIE